MQNFDLCYIYGAPFFPKGFKLQENNIQTTAFTFSSNNWFIRAFMEAWSAWKDFKRRLEQLLFRCLNFPFIGHERTLTYEPFVDSK